MKSICVESTYNELRFVTLNQPPKMCGLNLAKIAKYGFIINCRQSYPDGHFSAVDEHDTDICHAI